MTSPAEDLFRIADEGRRGLAFFKDPAFARQIDAIATAAAEVGRAWSGSNIGHHARVYTFDLSPRPAGVLFSSEWGLQDRWPVHQPHEVWSIHDHKAIVTEILRRAGGPDLDAIANAMTPRLRNFEGLREAALSVLMTSGTDDPYLTRKREQIGKIEAYDVPTLTRALLPSRMWSRDTLALSEGGQPAPHQCVAAVPTALRSLEGAFEALEKASREAASHLQRKQTALDHATRVGTNIFIGHGRSSDWRELKDFITSRLSLPVDEFNSIPVAGLSNVERLAQMLDAAAFAFLVMTAEDERADGSLAARMNVIHEVGLFQGRLGFRKAIVLLEDGCAEFSNIHGLGQIRFPTGRIGAVFESVRAVLEREGIIEA